MSAVVGKKIHQELVELLEVIGDIHGCISHFLVCFGSPLRTLQRSNGAPQTAIDVVTSRGESETV